MTELTIQNVRKSDISELEEYLYGLSEVTRQRFGPHQFDSLTLEQIHAQSSHYRGYIARSLDKIIAYTVIKLGYLEHDQPRLSSYGLELSHETDCTIAPSVADGHQGQGIGRKVMRHVIIDLTGLGYKKIILWGGVQVSNQRAINLYRSLGFQELGQFEYNGLNLDMILAV